MPEHKRRKQPSTFRGACALIGAAALVAVLFLLLRPSPEPLAANPYTEADFTLDSMGLIHCTGARTAVDVSEHQRQIRWQEVAEAGVELALVRVGYRGYSQGGLYADAFAQDNLTGAAEAGLAVGAYFFSQAISVQEAREEAIFAAGQLQGHRIDGPVIFDWEPVSAEDARTADMTGRLLTDCALAFCQELESRGYRAGIYFNQYQAGSLYSLEELTDYVFWLAMYQDAMTYPYAMDLWQYSCRGRLPGIDTDVDLNLWFAD